MNAPTPDLEETVWTVTAIGDEPIDVGASRSVSFSGGLATGRVGINRFSSRYEVTEGVLSVGPIMSTMTAGPLDLMALEMRFRSALEGRNRLVRSGNDLVIGEGGSSIRLAPEAAAADSH